MKATIQYIQKKESIMYFLLYLEIIFFTFRSLILNITRNLPDWLDYAAVNWMIYQNVSKITSLQFTNYFDTNAFYPHKYTLLFADTFIPEALMELPFYLITNNLILSFNIVFLLTFILNYISTFLFWKQIFTNNLLSFLGSLFLIFSPAMTLQFAHFQMIFIWPFFFSLYFLFKSKENKRIKNTIFSAIFLGILFLASVYNAFYLIFIILLFYLFEFIYAKNIRIQVVKSFIILFSIFLLIDGFFIKNYIDAKKFYNIHHDIKENITYSANLSDYIFTTNINSFIHQSSLIKYWNNADRNVWGGKASFPGFLLLSLFLFGLFEIKKIKDKLNISIDFKKEQLFFLCLVGIGFLFSLGPRITFNGTYAVIPTPYILLVKYVPLVAEIRAPARWYFLLILGLIYFGLLAIKKLQGKFKTNLLLLIIVPIFLLEYLPINITTHSEPYINKHYEILKNLCIKQKLVLLEIPITHLDVIQGIGQGVNYIATTELSSTYHQCNIVNGYSSYDMPQIFDLRYQLYTAVENNDTKSFIVALNNAQVDVIKVNQENLLKEISGNMPNILNTLVQEKLLIKIDEKLYRVTNKSK